MKKLSIFFALFSFILLTVNAQENDLYNVNYDPPKTAYDSSDDIFQDIYIQYEDLIKKYEDTIRAAIQKEESQKYEKALAEALEKQKEEIYAKETDSIRKKERELITEELYNDAKKNFEADLRNEISLENKNLEEKYKNDVRKTLESEYEEKKNLEIQEYKVLWGQEFKENLIKETNITTERIKYIALSVCVIAVLIFAFFFIKFLLKRRDKNNKISQQIETHANSYLERIQKYNGQTESIREELEKSSLTDEEKELHRKAIDFAYNKYKQSKETLSITEYKQFFNTFTESVRAIFADWNSAAGDNDEERKKALCNNFFTNINQFSKTGAEACHSKNNSSEVKNLLSEYTKTLENTKEQVQSLVNTEENKDIKKQLVTICKKYGELAKKFSKGDFK